MVLDSDGLLTRDFLEKALPLFDENYCAVQGRYIPSNRSFNFVTRMLALEGDLWSTPFMTIRTCIGRRCPLGGTGLLAPGIATTVITALSLACWALLIFAERAVWSAFS